MFSKNYYLYRLSAAEKLKRKYGIYRVLCYMRSHGMIMPIFLVHEMIGLPDYINRFGRKYSEVCWVNEIFWQEGGYVHGHSLAMDRSKGYYRGASTNGMNVIAIEMPNGNRYPWGWRFKPRFLDDIYE